MKNRACVLVSRRLTILLLAAFLGGLSTLSLRTDGATHAQTENTPALPAPVLTVVSMSAGAIELSWTAVPGAVRYEPRAFTLEDEYIYFDYTEPNATTFTHSGLEPDRDYYYWVRGVTADGETGAWSVRLDATASDRVGPTATFTATPTQGPTSTPTATPADTATPTQTSTPRPSSVTAQRAALVALYNATDGANWDRSDNWLSNQPLSTWYGVTTDESGNVIWLLLGFNNLSGSIPDLSALTSLRKLSLIVNSLNGSIPDLSALTSLKELRLVSNELSGTIPDLSALTNLTYLHLSSNKLSGSIPDLSALTRLTNLDLGGNELSGSIPDLSALTKLTSLYLYANELSGSIPALSALSSLEEMNLGNNKLSGQIPSLNGLTSLRELHIWDTQISGPIPDLSALTKLTDLFLYDNELSGLIPDLDRLTNLTNLYLNGNQLTGPIPDLSSLTKLESASFEGNRLCLPAGASLSHPNAEVAHELQILNLPVCAGTARPTRTAGPTQTPTQTGTPTPTSTVTVTATPTPTATRTPAPGGGGEAGGPAAPAVRGIPFSDPNFVRFDWEPVAGAAKYEVIRRIGTGGRWQHVDQSPIAGTGYDFYQYQSGTTFYLMVRSVGADGKLGPWSNLASATVPEGSTATPTATAAAFSQFIPTLTVVSQRATVVELRWPRVSGADYYDLRAFTLEEGYEILGGPSLTGTSYRHSGLVAERDYYYWVRGMKATGEPTLWSVRLDVTASDRQAPPATFTSNPTPTSTPTTTATPTPTVSGSSPPELTVEAKGGNAIELRWSVVPGATRYRVAFWTEVDLHQQLHDVLAPATSVTHRGLTPGRTYFYWVAAVDAAGRQGEWSQRKGATAYDVQPPTATPTATPILTSTATATAETMPPPTPTATTPPPASAAERAALVALYNATDGPNWTNSTNWLTSQPISSWYGVFTDTNGHVTQIDLTRNGLKGQLPDLSALTNLSGLRLSHNKLTNPFPDMSALTSLRVLNLGFNEFGGSMPDLSPLSNLTILTLNYNELSGKLPDLSNLTNLSTLILENNQFTGQIPDLSALTNLTTLDLSHNQFSGQFPDLDALTKLTSLDLGSNQFPGPFPDLSALTNLTTLALNELQLTGPIPDLSSFKKLTRLYLYQNQLTAPLPDLSALTNLRTLYLSGNQLTGPFPDLSALTNLTELYLGYNNISGPIPDLSALTSLTTLAITNTQLCLPDGASITHPNSQIEAYLKSLGLPSCTAGGPEQRETLVALYNATDGANWKRNDNWLTDEPIETWYGVFTNSYGHVTRLSLGLNGLSGPLPDLSALTNLTNVFLSGNQLTGQIPDLSALTRLGTLVLDSNQLTGPVPDLSALSNLTSLAISHNQLTGSFPDLSTLTNLTRLSISGNQLTGPFPDLSAHTYLRVIYLSGNQFTGPVSDLSALTNLSVLYLRSSQLSGQIPDLSANTFLTELNLGDNRFTGPFPDVSALTNLRSLTLNSNQLSGSFPDLSALTNLLHLNLESNQLSGAISDLSALTRLSTLNFSDNQLSGAIPDLSALTALTRLDLSDNQLTGPFPDISLLRSLSNLFLSDNQLSGPILDLNQLDKLRWLYLDDNQLTGPIPDLRDLTNLSSVNFTGNSLCLPSGATLSHPVAAVSVHLNGLNLPTCTSAQNMLVLGVPQNLTPTVNGNQLTLTWDAVTNADSYNLRVWNSIDRTWAPIGGVITTTTYTHTVQTDGRNYYYQIRSRNANDVRSAWSDRVYASVVTPQFPPPPLPLKLDLFYQKYLDVSGVVVVAPSEVPDGKMIEVRDVITSMLSAKPDLLNAVAASKARIAIYPENEGTGGITQLPELFFLSSRALGYVHRTSKLFIAGVPEDDDHCGTMVHEFGHVIHYIIDDQTRGDDFNMRLDALYQAARNAGRWTGLYAATNEREYWAEAVRFWFWETMPPSLAATYPTLTDYDPEVAKLVEEVFGEASLVAYCKP